MTIRIECEVSDIKDLLADRQGAGEQIGRVAEERDRLQSKFYDLEDELRMTKTSLENAVRPPPAPLSHAELEALIVAIANGNKISAIKSVRTMTGLGLKEAKDLVEHALETARLNKAI